MSRKDENGGSPETPAETVTPGFCAIEDHAKTMNVSAPVFAAVRQYKGWAEGKKIEKGEFEKAVKDFLNAPVGGV
jgi:hypothetical protein